MESYNRRSKDKDKERIQAFILSNEGSASWSELKKHLVCNSAQLTRYLSELMTAGLLERFPSNPAVKKARYRMQHSKIAFLQLKAAYDEHLEKMKYVNKFINRNGFIDSAGILKYLKKFYPQLVINTERPQFLTPQCLSQFFNDLMYAPAPYWFKIKVKSTKYRNLTLGFQKYNKEFFERVKKIDKETSVLRGERK